MSGGPYLCYRLFIPHGRFFDETVDFYIPISTRNDHPGPPEAHRHFHFSPAALSPRGKSRVRTTTTIPGARGSEAESPALRRTDRRGSSRCPASSEARTGAASEPGSALGDVPPAPRRLARGETSQLQPLQRERTAGPTLRLRPHGGAGARKDPTRTEATQVVAEGEDRAPTRICPYVLNV